MTEKVSAALGALRGRRSLVVEDEYMIAQEIAELLTDSGVELLGPVPSIGGALRMIAATDRIDVALLDMNLGSTPIWPVVDALLARHTPLVLSTGYDASAIPAAYLHLPRCQKPATGQAIGHSLAKAINDAASR